jgi:hypothetical protein
MFPNQSYLLRFFRLKSHPTSPAEFFAVMLPGNLLFHPHLTGFRNLSGLKSIKFPTTLQSAQPVLFGHAGI